MYSFILATVAVIVIIAIYTLTCIIIVLIWILLLYYYSYVCFGNKCLYFMPIKQFEFEKDRERGTERERKREGEREREGKREREREGETFDKGNLSGAAKRYSMERLQMLQIQGRLNQIKQFAKNEKDAQH